MSRLPHAGIACGALLAAALVAPLPALAATQLICNERPVTESVAPGYTEAEVRAALAEGAAAARVEPARPALPAASHGAAAIWRYVPASLAGDDPLVLDPARDRLMRFSSATGPAYVEVRGLHADSAWRPFPTTGDAPAIAGALAVLDLAHDRVILFGGRHYASQTSEVWSLSLADPPAWSMLLPAGAGPGGRLSHCGAYDPVRHRVIVFGGYGQHTDADPTLEPLDDTWALELDGAPAWSEIVTPVRPGRHVDASMVYDAARDRMVLHGGDMAAGEPGTWTLDLSGAPAWSPVATVEPPAVRRRYHAAIVDGPGDRMLIFGGTGFYVYPDTWSFSFTTLAWESLATSGPMPTGVGGVRAVWDAARHRMVVTGQSWTGTPYLATPIIRALDLDGAPAWSALRPGEVVPPRRYGHVAAMDVSRGRLVIAGGRETHYEPKYTYPMTFFGDAAAMSDPPAQWTDPVSGTALTPRAHHGGAIDTARDRLLVFGGRVNGTPVNEVWALPLGGGAWELLACAGTPPAPREGASAIYDPVGDRLLVYGAATGDLPQDVWELAFASGTPTWTRLRPAGGPGTSRTRHAAVYDPQLRRMIVTGGSSTSTLATAWAFELDGEPRWTSLPAIPGARYFHAACFDTRRNRTLVFGGKSVPTATDDAMNDVAALANGDVAWTTLAPEGLPPAPRYATAAVYDSLRDRMLVLFGTSGYCSEHTFGDVWELAFDAPTAAQVSLVATDVSPDAVRLAWLDAAGELGIARVERRTESSDWTEVASLVADVGRFEWTDHDVAPGGRYGYRLAFDDGGTPRTAGETWVDVPGRFSLALANDGANPSSSALRVRITLPDASAATLDVLDVAGRRVSRRALAGLGAGTHVVTLEGTDRLPAGVYRVRLAQSGHAADVRVALVH